MNRADVKSDETGEWAVVKSNGEYLKVYHRQRDAEIAARRHIHSLGGGEVVVHARTGRLKDVQTVPGNGGQGAEKQRTQRRGILGRMLRG